MTVRVSKLDNGMTVASEQMEGIETVSLGVWVGAGTRHETPEINGVAHLLEHMAFKGTQRRNAREIAETIEAVGGHLNAYTGREVTAYHAKVLAEDLPLSVDLMADILLHSRFDDDELVRERAVVLQEIGQAQDTPDDIIFDHFQETAYPDQPAGWPVLGRPETVRRLDRRAVIDFMKPRYGGARMVLAAAGKLDHEHLVDLANIAFRELPPESCAETPPAAYLGGEYREHRALEQLHLVVGFEALGFRDPDYYASAVFSTLLGGGMSSRLFQELRERRGLVYSVFSFLAAQSDTGLLGIYAGTGEAEARELLPVVCDELETLLERGPEEAELRRAKAQLRAGVLMGRERSDNRAEHLANQLLIHGRPLPPEEILARIDTVNAAVVRQFVERLLASRPTLALLGPSGGVERLDRLAQRLGQSACAPATAARL